LGLSAACQGMAPSNTSPLFYSVKQVVAHLQGLDERSQLYLFARTDLHENVQPAIKKALSDTVSPLNVSVAVSPIDNAGVHISFCGYAESDDQQFRRTSNPDRLLEVWRTVFTHPELVHFEPYCAKPPARSEPQ
jgi:hypothetical protein